MFVEEWECDFPFRRSFLFITNKKEKEVTRQCRLFSAPFSRSIRALYEAMIRHISEGGLNGAGVGNSQ